MHLLERIKIGYAKNAKLIKMLVGAGAGLFLFFAPIWAVVIGQPPVVGLVIGLIAALVLCVFGLAPIWLAELILREWKTYRITIPPTELLEPTDLHPSSFFAVPTPPPRVASR